MKTKELRDQTREELLQRKHELEEERFNLNMRKSLKGLDNPLRLRVIDRDIARILTVLREDEKNIRRLASERKTLLDQADKKDAKNS
jgi:large subunit ribosomal protein L29